MDLFYIFLCNLSESKMTLRGKRSVDVCYFPSHNLQRVNKQWNLDWEIQYILITFYNEKKNYKILYDLYLIVK